MDLVEQAIIRELALADKPDAEHIYISADGWQHLLHKATGELERYHESNPLRTGMPREELKSRLKLETHPIQCHLDENGGGERSAAR